MEYDMYAQCVECGNFAFGKRWVRITFFKPTGNMEWLPLWFHYNCLKRFCRNLKKYTNKNRIAKGYKMICAKCGKDTYGKKRIILSISDTPGQFEDRYFYFHHGCLKGLWDFWQYNIYHQMLKGQPSIFRRP